MPASRRSRLGEPDRRALGLGEHDPRHRGVVGGGRVHAPRRGVDGAAERPRDDHVAGGAALVLALVGEERAVVHVAHRVEPVALAVGAAARASSRRRRATSPARGRPSRGPTRCACAAARPVATSTSSAVTVESSSSVITTSPEPSRSTWVGSTPSRTVAPSPRRPSTHRLADERLHVAEQSVAGEHRDLGAEPGEGRGHLDGDEAAPDDREAGRRLLHARGVAARPRAAPRRGRRSAGSPGSEPVHTDHGVPRDERRLRVRRRARRRRGAVRRAGRGRARARCRRSRPTSAAPWSLQSETQ